MYKSKAYKLNAASKAVPDINAMQKAIAEAKTSIGNVKSKRQKLEQSQKAVLEEYREVRALIKRLQDQDINPQSAQAKLKVLDDLEKEISDLIKESKSIM